MSATIVVGTWSSHCSECGKSAMPDQTVHDKVYGYTPGPGCGAAFTHIATNYIMPGNNFAEWAAAHRPDLIYNEDLFL